MNYREIGKTGIKVSEISLGCWTLGGKTWNDGISVGWEDVNEDEAIAAINYAIDRGVNHFDNADVYGNGRAERLLAKALGKRNKDVIIATKVGHFKGTAEHAYESQHIIHQCEQSLVNLKREYIDIYYFHHGDFGEQDRYLHSAVDIMSKLKKQGKIRAVGFSAYSQDDFLRLSNEINPDVLQSWANIFDTQFIDEDSKVTKLMKEKNITFVAFSPLAKGLLLGKYSAKNPPKFSNGDHRKNDEKFQKEFLEKIEPKIQKLKQRFGHLSRDLARVALQYILNYDLVSCVIPGFRNKDQVEINLWGWDKKLTKEDVEYIRETFK